MKKISTLIVFLCFQFSFSQYNTDWEEAVVYLKDGTSLKGEGRMSMQSSPITSGGNETFRLSEGKGKPTHTLKAKDIDSIVFKLDFRTKINGRKVDRKRSARFIVFPKNEKKSKFGFAELLVDGKLRLLQRTVSSSSNNHHRIFDQQLIQFKGEIPLIGSNNMGLPAFKKKAKEYFQDCPTLVSKLEAKIYRSDDLEAIVNYFNSNCAK
ncbi:MAG: hypothetical protein CMC55_02080 [Flavobacteriaceae bacterium]|uniref:hypothetical protein n=1 Tax=Bizionia echini TaxID=649333 RepID=UPI000C91E0CF|nr:hypothetical protein [Flavobacteriaceae bacterium]|tara:strand:+ start:272 stop:898 length:627 start_codon:yes stop_codon:yes gene_type:complete